MNKDKDQYEKYPYPYILDDLDGFLKRVIPLGRPSLFWERLWPEKPKQDKLNILIKDIQANRINSEDSVNRLNDMIRQVEYLSNLVELEK